MTHDDRGTGANAPEDMRAEADATQAQMPPRPRPRYHVEVGTVERFTAGRDWSI